MRSFCKPSSLENRKLDIQEYGMQLDDTKNARDRDTQLLKAGYVNSRANYMLLGAGLMIITVLLMTLFWTHLDDFQKTSLSLVLGRALGYIDQGYNFEFGTTRASKQKDETIHKLSQ